MAKFVRLAETINKKKDMRVVSATVVLTVANCSGRVWFTDLQLQEGPSLTGYAPHTEGMLSRHSEDGTVKPPVWFNGIVRSKETVVLFNLGGTSAPLDIHIYPKCGMAAGTVRQARCGLPRVWAVKRWSSQPRSQRMMMLRCLRPQENVRKMAGRRKKKVSISTVRHGIPSTL